MRIKQCLKCNHSAAYEGAQPEACPACGAIYSKVEDTLRNGPPARRRQEDSTPSRLSDTALDVHVFAEQMRAASLYPAWRGIVGIFAILGYVVAALAAIGAIVATLKVSWLSGLVGLGVAAFIAIITKVSKEASLMLADLSDAAVHLAANSQGR
jgi:hypothetical protein